jgi:hypothetical protein
MAEWTPPVVTAPITIDHPNFLAERRYRRELCIALRNLPAGRWELEVVCASDESCCRWEPWSTSSRRIVEQLAEDGIAALWLGDSRGADWLWTATLWRGPALY